MINANNVTKKFGDFTALDSVSMSVETGSIFGLVGSNGAGKSTFMRLLSGVYRLDGGSISIDGRDIAERPLFHSQLSHGQHGKALQKQPRQL